MPGKRAKEKEVQWQHGLIHAGGKNKCPVIEHVDKGK